MLDEKLMAVERFIASGGKDGIGRLIVCMPPRSGKSEKVSVRFPAWFLGRNPDCNVILCSYGASLAEGFSRQIRDLIEGDRFAKIFGSKASKEFITKEVKVDRESRSVSAWNLEGHRGGLVAAGVGGPITGKGADCVTGDTYITTNIGNIQIKNLTHCPPSVKILGYDTEKKTTRWEKIEAFKSRPTTRIYRITTASGAVVDATGNHPFYVNGHGYKPANTLTEGDSLLLNVQCGDHKECIRFYKKGEGNKKSSISLFCKMYVRSLQTKVHKMWRPNYQKNKKILRGMSTKAKRKNTNKKNKKNTNLSAVQYSIQKICISKRRFNKVLQEGMCKLWPFKKNVGKGKSEVEKWRNSIKAAAPLRKGIQKNEKNYTGERFIFMCSVWRKFISPRGSSYRQLANEQRSEQFGDTVLQVPQAVACGSRFKTIEDTVARVEEIRGETTVYDIQVSNTHNFFANGVLTHNCLIIDDPIKDFEEADSEVMREKVYNWYTSTAYTRLQGVGSAVVVMATRWHSDDLIGRLLEDKNQKWEVLNFPAIAEEGDLFRQPGEALWPERYPKEYLINNVKNVITPRDWNSLYQQRPTAEDGDVFHKDWFKYREFPNIEDISFGIQVWDTAMTEKEENDASACVTAYVTRDGVHIADVYQARLNFPDLKKQMHHQYEKWNRRFRISKICIENRVSGTSVLQSLKKDGSLPIVALEPISKMGKSKLQRAYSVSGYVQAGRVTFERQGSFLTDFEHQLLSFPRGKHDDMVDAFVYSLIELNGGGRAPRRSTSSYLDIPEDTTKLSRLEALAGGYW